MTKEQHTLSRYAFLIHSRAVSWSTKQQEIISLSTTKSEYIAATYASKEVLWLCSLLSQLFKFAPDPMTLFSDNQSMIVLAKDHQYHMCMKHIDICFHFI